MVTGRLRRAALAAGLVAAASMAWATGTAEAGNGSGSSDISIWVYGADAVAVAASATPTSSGTLTCSATTSSTFDALNATQNFTCLNGGFSETIGVTGVPSNAEVAVICSPNDGSPDVISPANQHSNCDIYVDIPTVLIDKVIEGLGPLTPGDFDLEVYDAGTNALVTTVNDPSASTCYGFGTDPADCAIVGLDSGSYQLGEVPEYGYALDNVACVGYFNNQRFDERFPAGFGEFSVGANEEAPTIQYCEITNRYYEGQLIINKVVVNDSGGTAARTDFTVEVFEEAGGAAAGSQQCPADGPCLDVDLPIGTYRVGETGPAGYTATVACVETREPDGPPPPGTIPPFNGPVEALPGDGALAEILPFNQVTCTITNDDVPPPTTTSTTTTTTTTTIAPTTTTTLAQPTTLAPTTTDQGAGVITLPATGTSGQANLTMTIAAITLIAAGGVLLLTRRRTS